MRECSRCRLSGDDASFYPNAGQGAWCKRCIKAFRRRRVSKAVQRAERADREQVALLHLVNEIQKDGQPFVYVIKTLGKCKIGYSKTVSKRIRTFNTAHPKPCQLLAVAPGGRQLEQKLHHEFRNLHITGEWFGDVQRIIQKVSRLPGAMVFLEGYMTTSPPDVPVQ